MLMHIPEYCATRNPATNAPIMIQRNSAGYYPWPKGNKITPEQYNTAMDIDEAIIVLMTSCSMSGHWTELDSQIPQMRRTLEKAAERRRLEDYRPRQRFSYD